MATPSNVLVFIPEQFIVSQSGKARDWAVQGQGFETKMVTRAPRIAPLDDAGENDDNLIGLDLIYDIGQD